MNSTCYDNLYAHPSFLNQANTSHWHILSDIMNGSVFPYMIDCVPVINALLLPPVL